MKILVLNLVLVYLLDTLYGKKFITYWGQNSHGDEKPLRYYCDIEGINVINIGFLNEFDGIRPPKINLSKHCGNDHCSETEKDINYCREKKVTILLSLGGAIGSYQLKTSEHAKQFAVQVCERFIKPTDTKRKFGTAVLDGIDLDLEANLPNNYDVLLSKLRALSPNVIISATPQCPFLDINHNIVLNRIKIDWVSVQFYNNPCSLDSKPSLSAWSQWSKSHGTPLIIGAPANKKAAHRGFFEVKPLQDKLASIDKLIDYDGIMMWDTSYAFSENGMGPEVLKLVHQDRSRLNHDTSTVRTNFIPADPNPTSENHGNPVTVNPNPKLPDDLNSNPTHPEQQGGSHHSPPTGESVPSPNHPEPQKPTNGAGLPQLYHPLLFLLSYFIIN